MFSSIVNRARGAASNIASRISGAVRRLTGGAPRAARGGGASSGGS